MTVQTSDQATPRQIAFMRELADERLIQDIDRERLLNKLDQGRIGFTEARTKVIPWLLRQSVRPGVVPSHIRAMPTGEPAPRRSTEERPVNTATKSMRRDPSTLLTSGVFRLNNETYIIVPTRSGKHVAKRYVETPPRLTSSGETVKFDWVSAPGVIWALYEEHRLPVADIEALMIQHRVCIYPGCYRHLKAAKSVATGAGKRHAERLGIPWGRA